MNIYFCRGVFGFCHEVIYVSSNLDRAKYEAKDFIVNYVNNYTSVQVVEAELDADSPTDNEKIIGHWDIARNKLKWVDFKEGL